MTRVDEKIALVQKHLAMLERGLEAMRNRIKNPRTLALYSEGYVDQIAKLRAEIDGYRRKPAKAKSNGAVKKRKSRRQKV